MNEIKVKRGVLKMHFTKFKSLAAHAIIFHDDRGLQGEDFVNHSNENIDKSRTHLNYSLISDDERGYPRYKRKLEEVKQSVKENTGKNIRNDAVTLCSWVVTAPKDLPEDKHEAFFRSSYEWLCERYGEENVISATVHNDETTPHLHFAFMPIVEDEKGYIKLKAKGIETPNSLKYVHRDMQKHLESELKCPVNLLNGATVNGNKSILELQVESLQAENEHLRSSNEDLKQKALEYDVGKKGFFESKANYESRKKSHQQATAAMQQKAENDERERNLDEEVTKRGNAVGKQLARKIKTKRESELEQQVQQRDETINRMQITIAEQQKQLEYYRKYDNIIAEYQKKRKDDMLAETARGNNYTVANNEHYIHSR